MKIAALLTVATVLAAASAAHAGSPPNIWVEIPDAGELPGTAQMPIGVGPLQGITGFLTGPANDGRPQDLADAFCIRVTGDEPFLAQVTNPTGFDSQLFLFNLDGTGVTHNDDAVGLLSAIGPGAAPVGPVIAPGDYILAISVFDYDPRDAAGAELWADTPFNDETAPDGAGAANAVSSWGGTPGSPAGGLYAIALRGASFCNIPAPGASALIGLGGLLLARRRR